MADLLNNQLLKEQQKSVDPKTITMKTATIPKFKLCNLPLQDSFTPRLQNQVAKIKSPRGGETGGATTVSLPRRSVGIFGKRIKVSPRATMTGTGRYNNNSKTNSPPAADEWNETFVGGQEASLLTNWRKLAVHLKDKMPKKKNEVQEAAETGE